MRHASMRGSLDRHDERLPFFGDIRGELENYRGANKALCAEIVTKCDRFFGASVQLKLYSSIR
jgi:hypothetical protein